MGAQLDSIKAKLSLLKPELISKYPIASIGLFGSVVREDFTDSSDIDIIVEFKWRYRHRIYHPGRGYRAQTKPKSRFGFQRRDQTEIF
jgi:predicted nucleotidyltransferase